MKFLMSRVMRWGWVIMVLIITILAYGYLTVDYMKLPAVKLGGTNLTPSTAQQFAVFSCSTPTSQSHRGYDYAFYLPLTALAWSRIGFHSIVLIAGTEDEWNQDPALALVLSSLKEMQARVVFLDCPVANRPMLSQVGRIFAANMEQLQLEPSDYLITTDADLWPLLKSHYDPRPGYSLVLVHSECCSRFVLAYNIYRMLPMSNIGAPVQTWKDILNNDRPVAFDTESIMRYMERYFDEDKVRQQVEVDSAEWYFDQKLITVRITDWIERNPFESVFKVSDRGFKRLDRSHFHPELITGDEFSQLYDSHLPVNPTEPLTWSSVKTLVELMYGKQTNETRWCDDYAKSFIAKRTGPST